ncbi:MAG: hypothetical protein ACLRVU_09815 [Beduini sp.]|uniref:hypothetical protein n=1 Tax=Beduini sp. TaxID=1922300 RepID=UPI0039A2D12A
MEEKKDPNDWSKKNMLFVRAKYKSDFVDEFKAACKQLGITQSDVFREAMKKTIQNAKDNNKCKTEDK